MTIFIASSLALVLSGVLEDRHCVLWRHHEINRFRIHKHGPAYVPISKPRDVFDQMQNRLLFNFKKVARVLMQASFEHFSIRVHVL